VAIATVVSRYITAADRERGIAAESGGARLHGGVIACIQIVYKIIKLPILAPIKIRATVAKVYDCREKLKQMNGLHRPI
jgi:hypothetical protein